MGFGPYGGSVPDGSIKISPTWLNVIAMAATCGMLVVTLYAAAETTRLSAQIDSKVSEHESDTDMHEGARTRFAVHEGKINQNTTAIEVVKEDVGEIKETQKEQSRKLDEVQASLIRIEAALSRTP